jgi:hypothetical protein
MKDYDEKFLSYVEYFDLLVLYWLNIACFC